MTAAAIGRAEHCKDTLALMAIAAELRLQKLTDLESCKGLLGSEQSELGIAILFVSFPDLEHKVGAQKDEASEGKGLQGQTSDKNVRSNRALPIGFCGTCETATNCLDAEREHINANKDKRISLWLQSRVLFAKHNNHMAECDINGSGQKSRTQTKRNEICQEDAHVEWIRTHEDAANVADNFQHQAAPDCETEDPCAIVKGDTELDDHEEGEYR